jgi:serine/threonine protein kinase
MERYFGNYRILSQLSMGAFGSGYLGEDMHSGKRVYIKAWPAKTKQEVEDFLAEARIMAPLVHPNIIRVLYSKVEDDNTAVFVTTYAPYGTLRHHYRSGISYPLTTILPHIKQIASALQYIHDQKIVHCDVKPENILLGENNEVLLCDFGQAVVFKSSASSEKTEMRMFSLHYVAPERIQGEVSFASDQYALGMVVYEWLCGEGPFATEHDIHKMLFHHLKTLPPSLRSKNPSISPRIDQIVLRALSKDPQQRFPHVQDFATALEKVSAILGQVEIFFSYSHKDIALRDKLAKQLAHLKHQGLITEWHDRDIEGGRDWAYEVDTHLRTAHIILLLISPDFLASDYCYRVEMTKALKRHENGEAVVIPVILRPAPWMNTPLSKLQALPQGGKPIIRWSNQDEAFLDVADGIQKIIQRLTASNLG